MKIDFVAFDSFGVKSSCVFVETNDCKIVIDPGIAVEAGSFPSSWPEKLALTAKYELAIRRACRKSDVIVVSHYHYDHHIPDQRMYRGKILLAKDPKRNINKSQRSRAAELLEGLKADVRIADGKTFRFGETTIKFSEPMWHGTVGSPLGYVLMCLINDGEKRVLHTSDVDGPIIKKYADEIIKIDPDLLILDGAPTYILGYIHAYYNLARSIFNLKRIIQRTHTKSICLDHHLVRDYRYKDFYKVAFDAAKKKGVKLCTAAELLGKEPAVLKGYKKHGPTKWKHWKPLAEKDLRSYIKRAKKLRLIK